MECPWIIPKPLHHSSWLVEKLSAMKLILSVKKVGDHDLKHCHYVAVSTVFLSLHNTHWKSQWGGKFRKLESRTGKDERSSTPVAELCPEILSLLHVYSEAAHQIYSTGPCPGFPPWMEATDGKQRILRGIPPASIFASSFIYNFYDLFYQIKICKMEI